MIESTVPQASEPDNIDFTILTGDLDAEHIAAVTAIVRASAAASGPTSAVSETASRIDADGWEMSRRDLRTPIHPGPGEWRRSR